MTLSPHWSSQGWWVQGTSAMRWIISWVIIFPLDWNLPGASIRSLLPHMWSRLPWVIPTCCSHHSQGCFSHQTNFYSLQSLRVIASKRLSPNFQLTEHPVLSLCTYVSLELWVSCLKVPWCQRSHLFCSLFYLQSQGGASYTGVCEWEMCEAWCWAEQTV